MPELVTRNLIPRKNPRALARRMKAYCFLLGREPESSGRGAPLGLWLPVVLFALVIFIASVFPAPEFPISFWNFDKLLHLAEYALLGILLGRAIKGTWPGIDLWKLYWLVAAIALIYGISDEFHQAFVPGRTVSIWDALSDGIGGFLGGFLIR